MAGIFLLLKYAFAAILPFLIGLAVALPLSSLSKKTARHFGGSEKAWSAFYVISFWGILLIGILALVKKLYFEALELSKYFENNADMITEAFRNVFDKLLALPSRIPLLNSFLNSESEIKIGAFLSDAIKNIVGAASEAAAKIAVGTPKVIVGGAVSIIASFYFCRDLDKIKKYFLSFFSKDTQIKIKSVSKSILCAINAYAKAYLKLFLISFFCIFAGLLMLRRKYAFLIALFLALFDLLPLFGAAIVLIPWGIILIAEGATAIGVGLIVLAGTVSVIRQICEPRFVSKELGIHPLATLAAMYIGLRIFGFWGMITAPVVILVIKQMKNRKSVI